MSMHMHTHTTGARTLPIPFLLPSPSNFHFSASSDYPHPHTHTNKSPSSASANNRAMMTSSRAEEVNNSEDLHKKSSLTEVAVSAIFRPRRQMRVDGVAAAWFEVESLYRPIFGGRYCFFLLLFLFLSLIAFDIKSRHSCSGIEL